MSAFHVRNLSATGNTRAERELMDGLLQRLDADQKPPQSKTRYRPHPVTPP